MPGVWWCPKALEQNGQNSNLEIRRVLDREILAVLGGNMTAPFEPYTLVLHEGANPRIGGVAVCGFTNAGMVGVISTSHIIRH